MKLFRKLVLFGGTYAGWKYLFDPQHGTERRAKLHSRFEALTGRADERTGAGFGRTTGTSAPIEPGVSPANDETLKEKIESEVLRHDVWPKGDLNIDVVGGVVTLRGELQSSEMRSDLEQQVRKVSGVVDVENLIHLPTEPAANKKDARQASRKAEGKGSED